MSLFSFYIRKLFSSRKDRISLKKNDAQNIQWDREELLRHSKIVAAALPGPMYYELLKQLHLFLKPEIYVEIGVETGKSLAFANPPTIAIGVDPDYQITFDMHTKTKLFKTTSDDFFRNGDLSEIFEQKKIDLAFIDGLHTFDQALKDFINIESLSNPNTVILFHDVYPVIPETADRNRHTFFWIGDTWKVMVILKKFRPDLKIFIVPTYTSGLAIVTNLDPASTMLSSRFDFIVEDAMTYDLEPYMNAIREEFTVINNDFDDVTKHLISNRPVLSP